MLLCGGGLVKWELVRFLLGLLVACFLLVDLLAVVVSAEDDRLRILGVVVDEEVSSNVAGFCSRSPRSRSS